ncbi:MAG: hypothetical protein HGA47_09065 [Zoogloea sp.]|nr:hypothetical protein [Zoogloea sp.]
MKDIPVAARRMPFFSVRWGAIFAGLVVGISVNLLLLLFGVAVGFAVVDVGQAPSAGQASAAAAAWNAFCMVAASVAGGYVAARSSGLRRASDGILHGVIAWGATMLLFVVLASSATGATIGAMLGMNSNGGMAATSGGGTPTASDVTRSVGRGDRQEAVETLQSRLGLNATQANRIVDQALALTGNEESATPEGRAEAQRTLRAASITTAWLSVAVLLSLIAAVFGGMTGARSGAHRHGSAAQRRAQEAEDLAASSSTPASRMRPQP